MQLKFLRTFHALVRQRRVGNGCMHQIARFIGANGFLISRFSVIEFSLKHVRVEPSQPTHQDTLPEADLVIQSVEHGEPAAERLDELCAIQQEQEWADHVASRIHMPPEEVHTDNTVETASTSASERIHLLEYKRYPESFRRALEESQLLEYLV